MMPVHTALRGEPPTTNLTERVGKNVPNATKSDHEIGNVLRTTEEETDQKTRQEIIGRGNSDSQTDSDDDNLNAKRKEKKETLSGSRSGEMATTNPMQDQLNSGKSMAHDQDTGNNKHENSYTASSENATLAIQDATRTSGAESDSSIDDDSLGTEYSQKNSYSDKTSDPMFHLLDSSDKSMARALQLVQRGCLKSRVTGER